MRSIQHDGCDIRSRGFTLVELMIVVAIIGLLSAIAIPAYSGYLRQSKISALLEHVNTAERIVKSEIGREAAGGTPSDIIAILNQGNRRAVGDNSLPAFTSVAAAAPGQVKIVGLGGGNVLQTGILVTITAIPVNGTLPQDYLTPLQFNIMVE